jgi:hypothetical protein
MMRLPLTPDLTMADRFLNALDPRGVFTFQTFSDRKEDKNGSFDPNARVFHGTLAEHGQQLIELNQRGVGIFVMVNEGDGQKREGRKTCRTKSNVIAIRALFVDLDGTPLEPVREALEPDIIVESSPGKWHGYWLVNGVPLEDFEQRQKQLAAKFSGDPSVHDLPRVMRVPGFFHHKNEPFMSRLVRPEATT